MKLCEHYRLGCILKRSDPPGPRTNVIFVKMFWAFCQRAVDRAAINAVVLDYIIVRDVSIMSWMVYSNEKGQMIKDITIIIIMIVDK